MGCIVSDQTIESLVEFSLDELIEDHGGEDINLFMIMIVQLLPISLTHVQSARKIHIHLHGIGATLSINSCSFVDL